LLRTLTHYWRVNLAVALGAAVAAAVLAGALAVGDSVRGSLRDLTLDRLGAIDHALVGGRFFREALAAELAAQPGFSRGFASAAPAVVLGGSARHADSGARASRVGIHGVDERFAALFGASLDLERKPGQVFPSAVINESLQRELGAEPGDALLLSFGRWSEVPRATLMGKKDPDDVLGSVRVTLAAVVPDRGVGRFGLTPRQQNPLNVFVSLKQLQRSLGLPGQVNAVLVAGGDGTDADLDEALRKALDLEDLGLLVRSGDDHFALESREFVLRPGVERTVDALAAELGAPVLRIQSHLANEIRAGDRGLPYSLVVALEPRNGHAWATLPLVDGTRATTPATDGILLNEWAATDLGVAVGDAVRLTYFVVGPREELTEEQKAFRVEGVVAMRGLGADPSLTPDYPGIQDAEDISAWEPPFPVDLDRIRTEDELYWDRYGATPKAFVAGATGRRLWSTRFGSLTSVRIGAPAGGDLGDVRARFERGLLDRLSPEEFGLRFRPVKQEGLRASRGATDFAKLFLSFSFFLILSAALLVGLLFRLGVEQRAGEIGLLLAVGHPVPKVRRQLLVEGGSLAAVGGLLGLAAGVGFAGLMMAGLRTIWRPAVGSSELYLHVSARSLVIGWSATLLVVLVSVFFAVRKLVRVPPPRLLAGTLSRPDKRAAGRVSRVLAWGSLAGAIGLLIVAVATNSLESPGLAFGTGSLLLVAGLVFFSRWCRASRRRRMARALAGMAARNSAWNPGRSVLSVALVGAACFMIVVVEVFRVEPGGDLESEDSGSGGFSLVAEADVALHQDLNSHDDRLALGFDDAGSRLLSAATVYPARIVPGDDASCLNLYQPEKPALLGVPEDFVRRGGFRFRQLLDQGACDDPWRLLEQPLEDGVVPAMADANSAQWILKVGLGDELVLENELGRPLRLRLVGVLDGSVFRSEVLISEKNLLEHFPSRTGASYFLIETPPAEAAGVARLLETTLESFGLDATSTRDKIAGYEAVQNTYLSTFQVLGGLGLLLGTVGLGVVLVRNVMERRGELATLRAFGFRRSRLAWIVLAENAFLLAAGVLVGTLAALAAVAPSLAGRGLPWISLGGTLILVLLVGMLSSLAAVVGTLRVPLLPALKAD
jgi:ABC-type antimicrobial peptide transport system permease subunit